MYHALARGAGRRYGARVDTLLRPRLFSLREANALVPMLQRTFVQVRAMREELLQAKAQLQLSPKAPALQLRHDELEQQVAATLRELIQLGIEVKAAEGLCDFRSKLAGRVVYLCWRFGEERVDHFHELGTGLAGRKPLPADGDFTGELLH